MTGGSPWASPGSKALRRIIAPATSTAEKTQGTRPPSPRKARLRESPLWTACSTPPSICRRRSPVVGHGGVDRLTAGEKRTRESGSFPPCQQFSAGPVRAVRQGLRRASHRLGRLRLRLRVQTGGEVGRQDAVSGPSAQGPTPAGHGLRFFHRLDAAGRPTWTPQFTPAEPI